MKIFGREPAVYVGLVEAVLALALSFGLFGLTQEQTGALVACTAALLGLYTAYVTQDTLLGAAVGFVKAALVVGVTFGFALTDEQNGAVIALVAVVIGFWQRTQTSPADEPSFLPA